VPSQAPLTPPEIAQAYGFNQIKLPAGYAANGQGQTIAIIEIGDTPQADVTTALNTFDAGDSADGLGFSLPAVPNLQKVDLSGGVDAGTEDETLLDVEWAHALAPAANLIIFETAPGSTYTQLLGNFMAAVSAATHYNGPLGQVSVVTMSYGFPEDQIPANQLAGYDADFTTPANHIGITFVASAGDDGAGFQQRYPSNNGNEPPEYPASSPNVVGVGGTTLIFPGNGSSAYPGVATSPDGVGESAWGNGSLSYYRTDNPGGGSGGGISLLENEPSYQSNYGLHYSNGTFNARTTPDVSFNADGTNSPLLIYDSYDLNSFGQPIGWTAVGGTSFSAPAWAALLALADEARAAKNESSLDGPSQTLPDLYQLSSNDYHDIAVGNDGYSAGPGYDLATGLGSPVASRVVGDLWGQSAPTANNDAYSVDAGRTLTVSAAIGVLTNDTDPLGETLTVSGFTQPAHGSVTVAADGSFTYQPNSIFSGTDSFTYTILDTGTGTGSTAMVDLTVNPGLPDLAPDTPFQWSGPLVVTTQSGSRTTASTITTAENAFVDWAFINQGNAAITTAFQTELLLDGQQIHTWPASVPLNPTGTLSITDFNLGQLTAGTHTVTVVADYLNQVTESNKNNNTISYTFTVVPPGLPDLAPYTPPGWSGPVVVATQTGATSSATAFSTSDTVYVNWAFSNQGTGSVTSAFQVELLLDGTEVTTWSVGAPLDVNASTKITDYSLGQLTAGTHTVTIIADPSNQVAESNKNNNTATFTFTVAPPDLPDLAPYTPLGWSGPLVVTTLQGSTTTATSIGTTNDVYINWAFINRGDVPVNSAYQFELLLDGTPIQTWSGPVPLDPSFYTYLTDFDLGPLSAGNHTVTVVADYLNQITEGNKNNNTISVTFTVADNALPDLAPYTPLGWSGPLVVSTQFGNRLTTATITTADTVYVNWAIINQGGSAITNAFSMELLLDGTPVKTWPGPVSLNADFFTYITDYDLGQLAAGQHTLTLVADYFNQVTESDKTNNTASYTFTVTQPALPDLAPYTPTGWSGPLVVSTQPGNATTATTITGTDTVYIDWAVVNQGNATTNSVFHTELLLDGVRVHTWLTDLPLAPTIYTYVQDYSLGQLTPGQHTVTIITNYRDELTESDLTNNTFSATFIVNQAPLFTSANSTTFTVGAPATFTVAASGFPIPTLSEAAGDTLPSGITFNAATGVLSGTPAPGSAGLYMLHFSASNGFGSAALQTFALTVSQTPLITSAATDEFTLGQGGTFTVTTSGFPVAALSASGMPAGVSFTDNGHGTATIAAVPTGESLGVYRFTITATNGSGTVATQQFTLTVGGTGSTATIGNVLSTAGSAWSGTVMSFAEAGSTSGGVSYAATITWGDGSSTPGLVNGGNGTYEVTGSHVYSQEGRYPITVTITDPADATSSGSDLAHVARTGNPPTLLTMAAQQFVESAEYYRNFITAAYQKYLGRLPDATGLNSWLTQMQHGLTDEQLEAGFIGSGEYIADHGGTDKAWIIGMYQNLLGRTPADSEVSYWLNQLANGELPTQVAYGFAASVERESQRVLADYQQYLGRSTSTAEVDYWVNQFVNHQDTNEQVIEGFIRSNEYFQGHYNNAADWLFSVYQDVLGRAPDTAGYNFWLSVLEQS
jgi:subtilase family serine protease